MSAAVHAEDHQGGDTAPAEVTAAKYLALLKAARGFCAELDFMAGVYPTARWMYDKAEAWADLIEQIDSKRFDGTDN